MMMRRTGYASAWLAGLALVSVAPTAHADEPTGAPADRYPPPNEYSMPPPPPYVYGPPTIKYREGAPIPWGYHRESHIRQGLAIAGGVTLGSLYLMTVVVAASVGDSSEGNAMAPLRRT